MTKLAILFPTICVIFSHERSIKSNPKNGSAHCLAGNSCDVGRARGSEEIYTLTKNPFRLIKLKSKTLSWLMVVLGGLVGSAPWFSTHNFSNSVCS